MIFDRLKFAAIFNVNGKTNSQKIQPLSTILYFQVYFLSTYKKAPLCRAIIDIKLLEGLEFTVNLWVNII